VVNSSAKDEPLLNKKEFIMRKIFKLVIEYIRWRFSEEGKQTASYSWESGRVFDRYYPYYDGELGQAARDTCHAELAWLCKKYPRSKQAKEDAAHMQWLHNLRYR